MDLQPINRALPESLPGSVRSAFINASSHQGQSLRQAFADSSGHPQMHFALNASDDEEEDAELLVMGFVGDYFDGLAADQIVKSLAELGTRRLNVRINSPGGFAFDGLTIFNALLKYPGDVLTTVEGLAGSAASLIAMGGNPVRMMANSSMFIHRSLGLAVGNATVMRDIAEFLDAVDEGILETYVSKTGLSRRKVNGLLDGKVDGTTMNAKEAKKLGFADEVVELKRKKKASNAVAYSDEFFVTTSPPLALVVPDNPPGSEIANGTGTWQVPALSDYTDDEWENVGPNTRAAIARHYAVVPENLDGAEFEDLRLPHHNADGSVNVDGVREALALAESLPSDVRDAAVSHLASHLPDENEEANRQLRNMRDRRMVDLRLAEIGV